ncbi:hypothetical protein DF223_00455 [Mycetocola zhujimingii]|uniref:Uncharacterized protein n=1 Tax=Mycetocola zhujimingii TaxID=2079792 RepID=A0A2U1TG53_9MICO|nr:hypothetical protein DF223_00455 [Mycetocola zhujimingii]
MHIANAREHSASNFARNAALGDGRSRVERGAFMCTSLYERFSGGRGSSSFFRCLGRPLGVNHFGHIERLRYGEFLIVWTDESRTVDD